MVKIGRGALAAEIGAIGACAVGTLVRANARSGGWKVVTVFAPREKPLVEVVYPGPLALLGDAVEVEMAEAPAGQGTELRARVGRAAAASERVRSISGTRPDDAVRAARLGARERHVGRARRNMDRDRARDQRRRVVRHAHRHPVRVGELPVMPVALLPFGEEIVDS